MNQYQNQYGTVYAVRDYKGAPQIMCRAKDGGDWLVSGTLAAQAAAAKTADEMQAVLDQHATAHGWQPVEAPTSAEPPHQGKEDAPCKINPPAPATQPSKEPPVELAPTAPMSLPAFDYSGLDDQTVQDLHLAEREFACGKRMAEIGLRRMADGVAIAHDALCVTIATKCRNGNGVFSDSEKTFGRWCESVGLNRKAAERLLQVSKLFDTSSPRQQKALEDLGPTLLYAAAKPSAPAELVQAVKDGDITTHKQYQEALAEIRARDAKINDLLEMSEAADRRADKAEQAAKDTARERDAALRRAAEAEKQRDGAREAARAAEAENDEMRRKLQQAETRPIEVAVAQPGEAQIEAWRQEGADRCAAALQDAVQKAHKGMVEAQNHAADLEDQLAQARPDADACQRTVDTIFETIESLRGLLRTQLRAAQLTPAVYGGVVGHLLQVAQNLQNTVRDCAPAGYTMNDDEEDFL